MIKGLKHCMLGIQVEAEILPNQVLVQPTILVKPNQMEPNPAKSLPNQTKSSQIQAKAKA